MGFGILCVGLGTAFLLNPALSSVLLDALNHFVAEGGIWPYLAVVAAGFGEGLLLVGLVFPGTFLLLVLVVSSTQAGLSPLFLCACGAGGIVLSYMVNAMLLARSSELRGHPRIARLLEVPGGIGTTIFILLSPAVPALGGINAFLIGVEGVNVTRRLTLLALSAVAWITGYYAATLRFGDALVAFAREGGSFLGMALVLYGALEVGLFVKRKRATGRN